MNVIGARYLYLWLNVLSLIVPLLFSFRGRNSFSKQWKFVLPAMVVTAAIFLLWDEWFTRMGIWRFNPNYLSGIYLFSLPLEEVLFFVCIPYACVFTHFALTSLIRRDYFASSQRWITIAIAVVLLIAGFNNLHRWYTAVTFLATASFLLYFILRVKAPFMGRFYLSYLVILIPFLIVNGILTGSLIDDPVVWYNDSETLGIRIGTIPVEDAIYAMLLILMNLSMAAWLERISR